jgi:transposase
MATYSQDLRDRVIDAALSGASARQAAARFGIGEATAIVGSQGPRGRRPFGAQASQLRRSKFDPHRGYLLGLIAETPDLTISELLERLLAERSVRASRATLWTFLNCCGLTFEKRMVRPAARVLCQGVLVCINVFGLRFYPGQDGFRAARAS